jgi:hypothetical protein
MKLHWSSDDENPPSKKGRGYRIEKTHVFIEQGNFGSVAEFVGDSTENSGLTAERGTMSFSL